MKSACVLLFLFSVVFIFTSAKEKTQESVCARRIRNGWKPFDNVKGTIRCSRRLDIRKMTKKIYRAMAGPGTDEATLMRIFTNTCIKQRVRIRKYYRSRYRRDLIKHLISESHWDLRKIFVSLMMTPSELNSYWLNKSMKNIGTDERLLLNIMLTMNKQEMKDTMKFYKRRYGKRLKDDLASELRGTLKKTLLPMTTRLRNAQGFVNKTSLQTDLQRLEHPHPQPAITAFTQILTKNSFAHLKAMVNNQSVCGQMESVIENTFSLFAEETFKGTLHYIVDAPGFFARLIHGCISNTQTHDDLLIWILVSRSEIDLQSIQKAYEDLYNHSMQKRICDDVSGTYKDAVVAILKESKKKRRKTKKKTQLNVLYWLQK